MGFLGWLVRWWSEEAVSISDSDRAEMLLYC